MKLLYKVELSCGHSIPDCTELITKKCAQPHGHNYQVEITVPINENIGFFDFARLKEIAWRVFGLYDHKNISNEYGIHTAEQFVKVLQNELMKEFKPFLTIKEINPGYSEWEPIVVKLWETSNSGAQYP